MLIPNKENSSLPQNVESGFRLLKAAWFRYLFVAAISAIIGGYFVYWTEFSKTVVTRVESNLEDYNSARQTWADETLLVTSTLRPAVKPSRLPTVSEFEPVRSSVNNLIKKINEMPAPNTHIETTGAEFRDALSEVLRRLAQYDASPEGFTRVVAASQLASARGDAHRRALEDFLGGSIPALKGSLL